MIKNVKKIIILASTLFLASILLYNCEPDADSLGSQFFDSNSAEGAQESFNVVAYNIDNKDFLRTDAAKIDSATLGAFSEGVFGSQKVSYITQLRLASYDPDFLTNPVVDSVVLTIKPQYAVDSVTTTTDDAYIYPDGNIAASKVVSTYPVKKYGKSKIGGLPTVFNIKVHEVNDYLKTSTDSIYSNKAIAYGTLLGSKVFKGTINSIKVTKDSDNSEITDATRTPSIRIKLDNAFFQTKILNKKGSLELKDAANFTRYFRGIRISVDENDGYLLKFKPDEVILTMYYKYDKTDNGVTTHPQVTYSFTTSSAVNNAHQSQIEYNRTGTPVAAAIASIDATTPIVGQKKLYPQGMGGPGIGLIIPATIISDLKTKFKNEKIAILSAKVRFNSDSVSWKNKYQKPKSFLVRVGGSTGFITDMITLQGVNNYSLVRPYDLYANSAYYDIGITKTIKDIVEKEAENKTLILNVGDYTAGSTGFLVDQNTNSRAYTPNRVVLIGTDPTSDKRVQLNIIYSKK